MSLEQAAGLSVCGCTAVQLVRRAKIKRGDSVFINGGSGGLGSILVQVAKAAVGETGRVVATCSAPKIDFVKSLGADKVIDYTAYPSLSSHIAATYSDDRFDIILDTVGIQDLYIASPAYLKPSGLFISGGAMMIDHTWPSILGFFWMTFLNTMYPSFLPGGVDRRFGFLSGNANENDQAEVKQLVESGKLIVPIDSVWEMADALKAYEKMLTKRARGKVMVHVQDV